MKFGVLSRSYLNLESISWAECCSEGLFSLDEGLDTVVHVLGQLNLVAAESSHVGDIKDTVVSFGVLTVGTTDLNEVLVSDLLELVLVLLELGEVDVDGSAHAGSEVGGASGDVAEVSVVLELGDLLDLGGSDGETLEDLADVGALLHRDDSELILLVDPHKEGLGIVVEDTTGLGPFTLETAGLQVLVTTLEEEVVSDETVTLSVGHLGKGVVLSLELTFEGAESLDDLGLNLETLGSGDGGSEGVVGEVTGNTDTGGVDHRVLVSGEVGAGELVDVHGGEVLVGGLVAVVDFNDLVHEGSEVVVRLVGASIDTDAGVGPFGAGEDSLLEREAVLVLAVLALLPDVTGKALGEEGGCAGGEVGEVGDILGGLQVRSHHGAVDGALANLKRNRCKALSSTALAIVSPNASVERRNTILTLLDN